MTTTQQLDEYIGDLAAFADLGTGSPRLEQVARTHSIFLVRLGDETELVFRDDDETVVERVGDREIKHASFVALLASERFANLRDWAAKQSAFLLSELPSPADSMELHGRLNGSVNQYTLSELDDLLVAPQPTDSTRVLLIDGPAGIGKTHFILTLARDRSTGFLHKRRPLILHVQSRGRTLSYLYDLIAYSLQRLRLDVTYDQIPALAKHGLITLAIDGFDELADPDGYDKAWSQVSDLIGNIRGSGAIILAGRETFIGRDRVRREIASISDADEVSVFTLQPPSKGEAIEWLKVHEWTEEQIDAVEDFLEPNSLALRPFFLKTLAEPGISQALQQTSSSSVLAILMEAMIEREITKFGEAVEQELTPEQRRRFVRNLMGEAAREMGESSSVSVSDASLAWLVEVALPTETSDTVIRLLKARAHAIGFLTNDDRPGQRRFFHDKFYEYFLSIVLVETISTKEISKFLSRNILGSSLLETFGTVLWTGTDIILAARFIEQALQLVRDYPPIDRTRRNLGALLVASLPAAEIVPEFELTAVDIDEARAIGTAGPAQLTSLIISQLDCRGADLSRAEFNDCVVYTLIGDSETRLPNSFPRPHRIQDISMGEGAISKPDDLDLWVRRHLAEPPEDEPGLLPARFRDHEAAKLLSKAARMKQYWLRGGNDVYATKVLENPWWPFLERILDENGLARIEMRPASGTDARFVHIRQADAILSEDSSVPEVRSFYDQLARELADAEAPA